jgi:L-methionine (R)-S-oxide reductase
MRAISLRPAVLRHVLASRCSAGVNCVRMDADREIETWLQSFLAEQGATSGTIHLYRDGGLRLAAAINIPPPVQQAVAWVPNGKGMAGLALERHQPILTCNLKEDQTGNVKPGAKAVDARAAVAIPVDDANGNVRAVVGVAFPDEREFSPADLEELQSSASTLPA